MPWELRTKWIKRASRGRLERPSSWVEVKGTSGRGCACCAGCWASLGEVGAAGAEASCAGGVVGWPLVAILDDVVVCAVLQAAVCQVDGDVDVVLVL